MFDANFWHSKWQNDDIGFHESEVNPLLVRHLDSLSLSPGSRIFLPLCGKTRDIDWLLSADFRVAGAELSGIAVRQLFADLGVSPEVVSLGKIEHFHAEKIDIFVGNVFDLTTEALTRVDAVYDRAALVALPDQLRRRYAAHLASITERARQLVVCYQYDQSLMPGPPFSISDDEIAELYGERFDLASLGVTHVKGGLKGCTAAEKVWRLTPKRG